METVQKLRICVHNGERVNVLFYPEYNMFTVSVIFKDKSVKTLREYCKVYNNGGIRRGALIEDIIKDKWKLDGGSWIFKMDAFDFGEFNEYLDEVDSNLVDIIILATEDGKKLLQSRGTKKIEFIADENGIHVYVS